MRQAHDLPIYSVGEEAGRFILTSYADHWGLYRLGRYNETNWQCLTQTSGNVSVDELRSLLRDLSKGAEGVSPEGTPGLSGVRQQAYIVITDVREELVVYVNGTPYLRCGDHVCDPAEHGLDDMSLAHVHLMCLCLHQTPLTYYPHLFRRELEMPAAALHHAGIHAKQV